LQEIDEFIVRIADTNVIGQVDLSVLVDFIPSVLVRISGSFAGFVVDMKPVTVYFLMGVLRYNKAKLRLARPT